MSDTTTPNLGLTLPAIGGSKDSWGVKLNTNFSSLDSKLAGNGSLGQPGWRVDVDGTIENWGIVTTNSAGVGTFFFSKPFPNGLLSASVTGSLGSNFNFTAAVGPVTSSSIQIFTMLNGAASPGAVYVRVLGH